MAELKCCPFCGGEAEFITRNACMDEMYSVRCKEKDCRGRSVRFKRAKHAAIQEWNRRANNG